MSFAQGRAATCAGTAPPGTIPRMPTPSPRGAAAPRIPGAWSVAYWVAAVLVYAGLGTQLPQAVFLGFWQCTPYLLFFHWLRPRLLGAMARGRPA